MKRKLILFLLCMIPIMSQERPAELRARIADSEEAKNFLEMKGACYKGEYVFTDYIYCPIDPASLHDLNKEFIRLRVYKKTNWKQNNCVLVHKRKEVPSQTASTLLHKEFDSFVQAEQELAGHYKFLFSFSRVGFEYALDRMRIFVEDIEGLPATIEVIAPETNLILELFKKLQIVEIIADSVPCLISKNLNLNFTV